MFLRVMELLVASIFLIIMWTQAFIPIWRGTPTFPLFRKVSELQKKLAEEKEATMESKLKEKIKMEGEKNV